MESRGRSAGKNIHCFWMHGYTTIVISLALVMRGNVSMQVLIVVNHKTSLLITSGRMLFMTSWSLWVLCTSPLWGLRGWGCITVCLIFWNFLNFYPACQPFHRGQDGHWYICMYLSQLLHIAYICPSQTLNVSLYWEFENVFFITND